MVLVYTFVGEKKLQVFLFDCIWLVRINGLIISSSVRLKSNTTNDYQAMKYLPSLGLSRSSKVGTSRQLQARFLVYSRTYIKHGYKNDNSTPNIKTWLKIVL